jgi:hypothetical protein
MPDSPDPCAAWDEDLSALHDAELAPARESEVRAHVEGCERCSARLGALRRVDVLLAATPLPEVPESLREATLARTAEQTSRGSGAGVARPAVPRRARGAAPEPDRRRRLRAPALGVAAAAAAALTLYLLGRPAPEVLPAGPPEPPIADEPVPALPPAPELPPGEPPPIQIVEPLLPPPFPPPPEPEVPEFVPELVAPEPLLVDLEAEPPEDLAVVLFGAERPDDFDVIANLEILERLLELDEGRG